MKYLTTVCEVATMVRAQLIANYLLINRFNQFNKLS
jgi:hypothetical protein